MTRDWWYPTAFQSWGPEERSAIDRVLASGRLTMGAEVEAFEHEFAAWHGMRNGVMVNSGSSANLVAVSSLFYLKDEPLRCGDGVMVPAIAWSTTYAPLVQHMLAMLIVDCDETWNACPFDAFKRSDQELSLIRLVVGCTVLGNATHSRWDTVSNHDGVRYIEDNCESLGARDAEGKLCGTRGLMSTFSFFWSHQISAIEGGMILTDDDECASLCRCLRAHGWTRDMSPPASFDDEYNFVAMGYNVRPLEIHAAVAREQLKKLSGFIAERQDNYARWLMEAEGLPIVHPTAILTRHSPFGLQFTVPTKELRSKLVAALRHNGIDCRLPTGGSFTKHPYGKPWRDQPTPNADRIHDTGMFLGNAPFPIPEKIEAAVKVMRGVL